jgi:hypothetical protein
MLFKEDYNAIFHVPYLSSWHCTFREENLRHIYYSCLFLISGPQGLAIFWPKWSYLYQLCSAKYISSYHCILQKIPRSASRFQIKDWCSKICFTITLSILKVSTSNFKYMFHIINHILCHKVHIYSTKIFRFISPWT